MKKRWCIPSMGASFVYHMEDVLDLYAQLYNPDFPVICVDEKPVQLIDHTRKVNTMRPGRPLQYDHHYKRCGTCNLFMCFQPLAGFRDVKVTDRRTKEDFVAYLIELAYGTFKEAVKIRMVTDQLNIHMPWIIYDVLPPDEAKALIDRFEFHHTPVHASWLNMVEIELSVLQRQCLDRRIPDKDTLRKQIQDWQQQRNQDKAGIDWQFSTTKARLVLKNLYPSYSNG